MRKKTMRKHEIYLLISNKSSIRQRYQFSRSHHGQTLKQQAENDRTPWIG